MQAVLRVTPERDQLELEVNGECFEVCEIDNAYEPYDNDGQLLIALLGAPPDGFPIDTVIELSPSTLDSEVAWGEELDGITFGSGPAGEPMVKTGAEPPEGFPASQSFAGSVLPTTLEEVDEFGDDEDDVVIDEDDDDLDDDDEEGDEEGEGE